MLMLNLAIANYSVKRNPLQSFISAFSSLHLGNLSPAPGSNQGKKRVGRGRAAGGRFCGRGAAGQKSRSGAGLPRGFTGGQTPLHISTPKYGFKNALRKDFSLINLGRIQHLIDTERIDASKPITLKSLYDAGITNLQDGVKILAGGKSFFKSKVMIQATQFSQETIARIEELGGVAVAVHHSDLALRAFTRPDLFKRNIPKLPAPVTYKERVYYSNPLNRGYLVPEIWEKCVQSDPEFNSRHVYAPPTNMPPPPILFKEFLLKKQNEIDAEKERN